MKMEVPKGYQQWKKKHLQKTLPLVEKHLKDERTKVPLYIQ